MIRNYKKYIYAPISINELSNILFSLFLIGSDLAIFNAALKSASTLYPHSIQQKYEAPFLPFGRFSFDIKPQLLHLWEVFFGLTYSTLIPIFFAFCSINCCN